MKKLLTLICVLSMLFSFAACESDEEVIKEVKKYAGSTADVSDDESAEPEETTESGETAVATDKVTATPEETEKTEKPEETEEPEETSAAGNSSGVSLGSVQDNVYENEFIGLGCKFSSDWTFYTDEQIKELNSLTADATGVDLEKFYENATLIYDAMATTTNGDSFNVVMEKMSAAASAFYDEKAYAEASESQVKTSMENIGYTVDLIETTTVTVAGEEYAAVELECSYGGVLKLYEKMVLKKIDNYMVMVTVGTVNENNCDDIIADFYAVE